MSLNIPWRMGINIRELAYYGEPETIFHQIDPNTKRVQIKKLSEIGVQVVRFYAPHNNVLKQQGSELLTKRSFELIGETLDLLSEFNMQAVVCLGDSLSGSGHFFSGDVEFHTEPSHGHLHRNYWLMEQYRHYYLPFLRAIVDRFKKHDAVLIWELGNEHAVRPQDDIAASPDAARASLKYLEFVRIATEMIRKIDRNALVGTGLVNSRHVFHIEDSVQLKAFARELYGIVDAVSLHVYECDTHEKDRLEVDAAIAGDLRKLLYIGEVGSNIQKHRQPRPQYYGDQIKYWRDRGAFMVMPWAFNATDLELADFSGVSKTFNDFERLVEVISENRGSVTPFIPADIFKVFEREDVAKVTAQVVNEEKSTPKYFQVTTKLYVRSSPHRSAKRVRIDGQDFCLSDGDIIEVDPNSRNEIDEHVWWEHRCGWSSERPLSGSETYLKPIKLNDDDTIIDLGCRKRILPALFKQLPVEADKVGWLQYFGCTTFAEELARGKHGDDNIASYTYSQGFHAGIDFGNKRDEDLIVRAGVTGKVLTIERNPRFFKPKYLVILSGNYTVIYGHLSTISDDLHEGRPVKVNTPIGTIKSGRNQHLHLEVRQYMDIINPFLVMSAEMRDTVMRLDKPKFFKSQENPTLWQEALEQPVIRRGGVWLAPWQQPLP